MTIKINDNELIGNICGDLRVIEVVGRISNCIKVKCVCLVCGRINEYWYKDINRGVGSSHRQCSSRLHKDEIFYKLRNTHSKIKDRCDNERNARYKYYGGRGIKHEFELFIDFYDYTKPLLLYAIENIDGDMYNLSLDRIDNDSGYVKGNLRFVTQSTQINNSSKILKRKVTFYNRNTEETIVFVGKTLKEISEGMGWSEKSTRSRIGEKKYYEWTITTERCND